MPPDNKFTAKDFTLVPIDIPTVMQLLFTNEIYLINNYFNRTQKIQELFMNQFL